MKTAKTRNSSLSSNRYIKDLVQNKDVYILFIPVLAYFIIFKYLPMYGAMIAFKDYVPAKGILGSNWVGFKHFARFFSSPRFGLLIRNTFSIGAANMIFGFPVPIIIAVLFNELRNKHFKKLVQTVSYLPHFISLVVICSMIRQFTSEDGFVSAIVAAFGGKRQTLLNVPEYFLPIHVISGIWKEMGWNSIVYIAAISGINQELYEAARIDGASRIRQIWSVTLPGILPTIIVMLILRLGSIIGVGYEKIILLYNPLIYDTSDVISTYVYRTGLLQFEYSFSSAVGLFNSVINFIFLFTTNKLSRKVSETSLW